MNNYMKLEIVAIGENERFARNAVAAFALSLNPSLAELSDIKTAVSEAVTNCILHAYAKRGNDKKIFIECRTEQTEADGRGMLHIQISDHGCGISDVEKALLPFYTTLANEERSGMGFTIMHTLMDDFSLESKPNEGTMVSMIKNIGAVEIEDVKERLNS